mgnify:CR=1 FL=1
MDKDFSHAFAYLDSYREIDEALKQRPLKSDRLANLVLKGDHLDVSRVRAAFARLLLELKNDTT